LGIFCSKCQVTVIVPATGFLSDFQIAISFPQGFLRPCFHDVRSLQFVVLALRQVHYCSFLNEVSSAFSGLAKLSHEMIKKSFEPLTCYFILSFDFLKQLLSTQPFFNKTLLARVATFKFAKPFTKKGSATTILKEFFA